MNYTVSLEGFEGRHIEVTTSFWSGPRLLIDGELVPKGNRRGELLLRSNNGRQVIATWKPQFFGLDVSQLIVDNKVINLVEPLKWYQWVWGGLPIALVFIGGALGGLAGAIGFTINAKVFRMEMNTVLKYVVSGAVSILAVVAYYIAAILFTIFLHRL